MTAHAAAAACALLGLATLTPSARAVSTSVVISEVFASGGVPGAKYSNDFVVLYNLGTTTQNFTGWSLQFPPGPSHGPWSVVPLSGSIAAGHFYLVQLAAGPGIGVALPTPDASGAIDLDPAGGVVALMSTTTGITSACPAGVFIDVDMVGYGSGTCSETAPTGSPDLLSAMVRAVPCVDTDNNAADFLPVAASPENSGNTYSCLNHAPTIQAFANQVLSEGAVVTLPAVANDLDGNTLTFSVSGPAWCGANPSTGVCTLSPDLSAAEVNGGVYNARVTVSDGLSYAQTTFTITVTDLTTSANIPFSGMWPAGAIGGANMGTGELALEHGAFGPISPSFPSSGGGGGGAGYRARKPQVLPPPISAGTWSGDVFGTGTATTVNFHYASRLDLEGIAVSHCGPNWLCTYDGGLFTAADGSKVVWDDRGEVMRFQPSPAGGFTQGNHFEAPLALAQIGAEWHLYRSGTGLVYVFDASGRLIRILDANANTLTLAYDAGGLLATVSDGLGRVLTFTHTPGGLVSSVSNGTTTESFGYTGSLLTTITDAAGGVTTVTYAAGPYPGLVASVRKPAGNTTAYGYDAQGRVISCTDGVGSMAHYAYGPGIESAMTEPSGAVSHAVLDQALHLISLTDNGGRTESHAYDGSGRPSAFTHPLGGVTTVGYDATSGLPNDFGRPDGAHATCTYGPSAFDGFTRYLPTSTHAFDGSVVSHAYDAQGNEVTTTDELGKTWTRVFGPHGELLSVTNPTGGVTQATYDGRLDPATFTDAEGHTSHFTYDAGDRLVGVTHPDATSSSLTYNALDEPFSVTDENGHVHSFAYDANGRETSFTDPLGNKTLYAYNADDQLIAETDPLGNPAHIAYNADALPMTITDRSGRATKLDYDASGNLIKVTGNDGNATTLSRDANGQVVGVTDALGHASQLVRDVLGRLVRATNPAGSWAQFGFDAQARVTSLRAPLGHAESYTYNARGERTSQTNASARTSYGRTDLGEVASATDPNGNISTYAYDGGGWLGAIANALGQVETESYDSRQRLVHGGDLVGSWDNTYDAVGQLAAVHCSDGTAIDYTRDAAGRLTGATGFSASYDAAGHMTLCNGIGMTYGPSGELLTTTYEPGWTVTRTYNAAGQIVTLTDGRGRVTTFTHDANHRLTGVALPNGVTQTRAYDAAGRLAQLQYIGPGGVLAAATLTRDSLARVVSAARTTPLAQTALANTQAWTYDAGNRTTSASWDARGQLLNDGPESYKWDGAGRLIRYYYGPDSVVWVYDAFGNPVTRTAGGVTHTSVPVLPFKYGSEAAVEAMVDPGLPGEIKFVYGPSGPLYQVDVAGNATYYGFDDEDNLAFVMDEAGDAKAKFAYSPTGEERAVDPTGAASNVPFRFKGAFGALTEPGTGLVRFGASVYDAKLARNIGDYSPPIKFYNNTTMTNSTVARTTGSGPNLHPYTATGKHPCNGKLVLRTGFPHQPLPQADLSLAIDPAPVSAHQATDVNCLACHNGTTATLESSPAGPTPIPYPNVVAAHVRIGEEGVVDFLEGDPDQPFLTGRSDGGVSESISLNFNHIEFQYKEQRSEGGAQLGDIHFGHVYDLSSPTLYRLGPPGIWGRPPSGIGIAYTLIEIDPWMIISAWIEEGDFLIASE